MQRRRLIQLASVRIDVSNMLNFAALLIALLSPLCVNEAQGSPNCFYEQNLELGQTYYIYNSQYPNNYYGESQCRWVAYSQMPIKINCTFEMPASNGCSEDVVTVVDPSVNKTYRYCGSGNAVLDSQSSLTITLISSDSSQGGKFLCELRLGPQDDNNCHCGWKNPTRIVGGNETGVNEYPMMAGLVDTKNNILYCGATIINERQVLTAAHCVEQKDITKIGVVVGEHDVTTGSETNATKLFRVDSRTIHPNYSVDPSDLAIITIIGTISFNQKIGPVCLPFQHSGDSFNGNHVDVLGWGLLEFAGKKSTTLQMTTLSVIDNVQCQRFFSHVTTDELCTYEAGKDFCQLDTGGPILWENPTTHNIVGIGVASSGVGCASDVPAVSTRIGAFINWIEANTPPGIQYCKIE